MDNNWVVDNLQNAFTTWNTKMEELWGLLTQSPETFKGGTIWSTIVTINGGMQAIGYGLLVLFFAISLFRSAASFRDFQRPEYVVRHLIQFVLAKVAITYGMDFLTKIFAVCNGIVATAAGSVGGADGASITMPTEMIDAINNLGFLESIPLWLVTLLGSLFITVLAFIMILTVYGRFFKLYSAPGRAAAYVKPPVWCFYSTPRRRFTQSLGQSHARAHNRRTAPASTSAAPHFCSECIVFPIISYFCC